MDREKFLARIKENLRHTRLPEAGPGHPGSFQGDGSQTDVPTSELVKDFKRELEALAGNVHILVDIEATAEKILEILRGHQTRRILAWEDPSLALPGISDALTVAGVTIERVGLSADGVARRTELLQIDDVIVGLTGAHGGLADTGAIALISGPGRSRLASLLPPVHIALLSQSKIYPSLSSFLAAHPAAAETGSNLVFIAGPSRSGDIELTLSMGVHGPGEVHVIILP
jgi:L-lactate dehydrogenase complex protein LldG